MKEKHFCRGLFQAYKQLYACWRKHLAGLLSLSPLAECAAVTRQREMQSRAVEDICSKLCRIRSMCMLSQKKARRPVPGERKAFQRKRGGGRLSTAPEFLSSLSHFLLSVFQELNLKVKYSVFLRSLVDEKSVRVYRSVHEEVLIKKRSLSISALPCT
ncbi:hypothetical protein NECID01_0163 [Nematocida sp. AWRm77]|nr:hypothetical protein NECID01_0163 [Nematocida sp. AWRm77]